MTNKELLLIQKNYNAAKNKNTFAPKQNNREVSFMSPENDVFQDDVVIENKARAEFGSSVAIRQEFGNVDRYIAFRKAEARGGMKIIGGVVRGGTR